MANTTKLESLQVDEIKRGSVSIIPPESQTSPYELNGIQILDNQIYINDYDGSTMKQCGCLSPSHLQLNSSDATQPYECVNLSSKGLTFAPNPGFAYTRYLFPYVTDKQEEVTVATREWVQDNGGFNTTLLEGFLSVTKPIHIDGGYLSMYPEGESINGAQDNPTMYQADGIKIKRNGGISVPKLLFPIITAEDTLEQTIATQEWVQNNAGGGGGSGTSVKLYKHVITLTNETTKTKLVFSFPSPRQEAETVRTKILYYLYNARVGLVGKFYSLLVDNNIWTNTGVCFIEEPSNPPTIDSTFVSLTYTALRYDIDRSSTALYGSGIVSADTSWTMLEEVFDY